MSAYDFLSVYFPALNELDPARLLEWRSAASTLIRTACPSVDTAPNSPFGDLHVSPSAPTLASFEEMFNRLLSDMDPENAESGTVWNCDWVTQYLLTYGIQDEEFQRSYGLLRLVFSTPDAVELDRSTEFKIGEGIYRPFAPRPGPLSLLPPGVTGTLGNFVNFSFYGEQAWVVDILMFGVAGQTATAGERAAVDRNIPNLSSAVALSDFSGGTSPDRIQELARRVRHNFHSRTPATRGCALNLVHQQFPELTLTGCTISGDPEQLRDVANLGQVAAGKLDLMVRSEVLLEDTVTVRLYPTVGAGGARVYTGWLDLPETPIQLVAFSNAGIALDRANLVVYSISDSPTAPGLTAAYGASERLLCVVPYAEDSGGVPLYRTAVDTQAGVYVDLDVTYLFDPALKTVQEFMRGEENTPAGLDLYVRWFVPVVVHSMEVSFNRKAGAQFNLSSARAEISSSYNSSRYETPAGPAVVDAALYYAGAHSINGVTLDATVRYSVADQVWLGSSFELPALPADWESFEAACLEVPQLDILSPYSPDYDKLDLPTYAASGSRNISYLLPSSALKLTELRSV